MPVLWALYQALSRVDFLKHGTFLWFEIGAKDPTFICLYWLRSLLS
jgi:YidC/Oxa1 family membrane protein insertase